MSLLFFDYDGFWWTPWKQKQNILLMLVIRSALRKSTVRRYVQVEQREFLSRDDRYGNL